LRTGKTNVISLILNTEQEVTAFSSDMIYGISEVLADTPYHLILTPYSRRNDPMEPVRYVVETGSADGIIISRTEPDDPRVRYMVERGFPFATHGRTDMGLAHPFHDFDNFAYARQAARALIAAGRRRLALLAPPPALTYHRHMRDGFHEGVLEGGATEVPFNAVTLDSPIAEIKTRSAALMRRPNRPDGIVSGSGGAAFAIVAGIEEAGLLLGRDVDLVSKQSSRLLHWFRPQIFTVDEDIKLAGRELARAVLKRIEGADAGSLQTLSVPDAPARGYTPGSGDCLAVSDV
jgi:LacI family transcriptional regulator